MLRKDDSEVVRRQKQEPRRELTRISDLIKEKEAGTRK